MTMFKFFDADHSVIQPQDGSGRNIPNDPRNAHYRELVKPWLDAGNTITPYTPDPAAVAGARQAKVATRMLAALADDANAGKTLDQIRAEAKAAAGAQAASK